MHQQRIFTSQQYIHSYYALDPKIQITAVTDQNELKRVTIGFVTVNTPKSFDCSYTQSI